MAALDRVAAKPFNVALFMEELGAAVGACAVDWEGFQRQDATANVEPAGRRGAVPGALRFRREAEFTPQEIAAIDAALAAHDARQRTVEQTREAADEADLDTLVGALAALDADLGGYDAMTNAQKLAAVKRALMIQRRMLRVLVRKFRAAAV